MRTATGGLCRESRNDNESTFHETIVHSGSVFLPVLRRISLAIFCMWTTMAIFSSMGKAASRRRRARFARKRRSASSFTLALGSLKSELHQDFLPLLLQSMSGENHSELFAVYVELFQKQ